MAFSMPDFVTYSEARNGNFRDNYVAFLNPRHIACINVLVCSLCFSKMT